MSLCETFFVCCEGASGLFKSERMKRTAPHVSHLRPWTLAGSSAVAVAAT